MNSLPVDQSGWTILPVSTSTHSIYISSSSGNDANAGTIDAPVKTIAAGMKLVSRTAQNAIYLKCGDTFTEEIGQLPSGPSAAAPTVLSSYGDGPRPLLRPFHSCCVNTLGASNVFISGLDFSSGRRNPIDPDFDKTVLPTCTGLRMVWCNNFLIEDCSIKYFALGVDFEGQPNRRSSDITIRRTVIADNYDDPTNAQHSQGAFIAYCDNVLIEECVIDHNGWMDNVTSATIFNHNLYIHGSCSNLTVRNNIISRASSHGCQARCGGDVTGNLFLDNPLHLSYGLVNGAGEITTGGVCGNVTGNIMFGSNTIAGQERGVGVEFDNIKVGGNTSITKNVIAHSNGQPMPAFYLHPGNGTFQAQQVGINDLLMEENIVLDWKYSLTVDPAMKAGGTGWTSINRVTLTNNYLPVIVNGDPLGTIIPMATFKGTELAVSQYAAHVGLPADAYQLVSRAAAMTKSNWDDAMMPKSIIPWLQAGFYGSPTPLPATLTGVTVASDAGVQTVAVKGSTSVKAVYSDGSSKQIM